MKTEDLEGYAFTEDNLIPLIMLVLDTIGGRASKKIIEKRIYDLFRDEFKKEYWHEKDDYGVPRWKKYIAWAKERAKQIHKYIESPQKSGRGFWELTQKGKENCLQIKATLKKEVSDGANSKIQ